MTDQELQDLYNRLFQEGLERGLDELTASYEAEMELERIKNDQ